MFVFSLTENDYTHFNENNSGSHNIQKYLISNANIGHSHGRKLILSKVGSKRAKKEGGGAGRGRVELRRSYCLQKINKNMSDVRHTIERFKQTNSNIKLLLLGPLQDSMLVLLILQLIQLIWLEVVLWRSSS
jgi:hypothetical protein